MSTAGNDTQLKTRIVTVSHLQCSALTMLLQDLFLNVLMHTTAWISILVCNSITIAKLTTSMKTIVKYHSVLNEIH